MRRILIIIGTLILLVALGLSAYFLFFAKDSGIAVGPDPFGSSGDRDPGVVEPIDTGVPTPGAGTVFPPRLMKLTDGPVAKGTVSIYFPPQLSAPVTASSTATTTQTTVIAVPEEVEVRYIDRQSGNVYSFRIHERTVTRLSNKTLPGIEDASWTRDGSRAFVRFLEGDGTEERVSTYLLPVSGEGGYFLEQGLAQITAASSTVLTLLSSGSGSVATIMNTDGSGAKTLFSSVMSSLRVAFAGNTYVAQTKASAHLDGYAFTIDTAGTFTRVLGPLRGLSTLPSPSGAKILYSYADRGKIYTQVLDTATRTAVPLPLSTLPEKCAWTPRSDALYCGVPTSLGGTLPDDWYQGARSFSDRVWRIDLATRVATLTFDPRQLADVQIDAQALSLDSGEDVLVFMNKVDGSLWSYDL